MIYLKNAQQLECMRKAGAALYEVEQRLREIIKPDMTTLDIDAYAAELIRKAGAKPSFLHYQGYPASVCCSVNEQVVHGIPSAQVTLREGDIISVDGGLILDGWQADSAFTVGVGKVTPAARQLMEVTERCFFLGARQAVVGKRLGDIGHAVQEYAEAHGYGVIRDLTGHGIGRAMHEDPPVYNFGRAGEGKKLHPGMTICIEPMIAMCGWMVEQLEDGWTVVTEDGSLCSHYEHTLAINEQGLPELLTYPGYTFPEEP